MGVGTLARWLADHTEMWHAEAEAVHLAGLASGPWQATDQISTRVVGQNEVGHIVGNDLFTSFHTRPGGTRQVLLAVRWGQEPVFRLNDDAQTGVPIGRWLLTDEHGLCWVHDGRHDAKLSPVVPLHQQVLADFRRNYWALYRELVAYREAPTQAERERLAAFFDQLVACRTGYADLDARIAKTAANRELLLAVLNHPALPLHNNVMGHYPCHAGCSGVHTSLLGKRLNQAFCRRMKRCVSYFRRSMHAARLAVPSRYGLNWM